MVNAEKNTRLRISESKAYPINGEPEPNPIDNK